MKVEKVENAVIYGLEGMNPQPGLIAEVVFSDGKRAKASYEPHRDEEDRIVLRKWESRDSGYGQPRGWEVNPRPAPNKVAAVLAWALEAFPPMLAAAQAAKAVEDAEKAAWEAEKRAFWQKKQAGPELFAALEEMRRYVDGLKWGQAWAGRPHELMDRVNLAIAHAKGEKLRLFKVGEPGRLFNLVWAPSAEQAVLQHIMSSMSSNQDKPPVPGSIVAEEEAR